MRIAAVVVVLGVGCACGGNRGGDPASRSDTPGPVQDSQAPEPDPPASQPPAPTCSATATPTLPLDLPTLASKIVNAGASAAAGEACTEIEAADDASMRRFVTPPSGIHCHSTCLPGTGDATGTLAFPQTYHDANCHSAAIDFLTTAGAVVGHVGGLGTYLDTYQQPAGLLALGRSYLGPSPLPAVITAWHSGGGSMGDTAYQARATDPAARIVYGPDVSYLEAAAPDPGGGLLVAGDLRLAPDAPFEHAAVMFEDGVAGPAIRWGPRPLDSDGVVLGVGVDVLGASLVLTDGASRFGDGHVAAQWFGRDGTPLTCAFALFSGYAFSGDDGQAWLEAWPLIGGGLAVSRVDRVWGGGTSTVAVAVVESGRPSFTAAPDWMTARPSARFQIVRGGRAYAALPLPGAVTTCSQRVEVLAPDGSSCGVRDYPIAQGACQTRALTVAADGTVIQQLPESMEVYDEDGGNSCTWRWWPGSLR